MTRSGPRAISASVPLLAESPISRTYEVHALEMIDRVNFEVPPRGAHLAGKAILYFSSQEARVPY